MRLKIIKILIISKSCSASFIHGMRMPRLVKSVCMAVAYKVKVNGKQSMSPAIESATKPASLA